MDQQMIGVYVTEFSWEDRMEEGCLSKTHTITKMALYYNNTRNKLIIFYLKEKQWIHFFCIINRLKLIILRKLQFMFGIFFVWHSNSIDQ